MLTRSFMLIVLLSLFCNCIFRKGLGDYVNKEAIYVSIHGSDENDGTIYTPVKTISRGIALMKEKGYRTVKVAKGVFKAGEGFDYPDSFTGMLIDFTAEDGFTLEGGWESGFEKRTDLISESDFTVLDGGLLLETIMTIRDTSNVTIDGFLFRNNSSATAIAGGGINIYNSSRIMVKGSVMHCLSGGNGGAIYIDFSKDITIDRVTFTGNDTMYCGALCVWNTENIRVTSSNFENNSSDTAGGGLFLRLSRGITLKKNIFKGNNGRGGAAVAIFESSGIEMKSNYFEDNLAGIDGGILSLVLANNLILKENLFRHNGSDREGGAIRIADSGSVTVQNSSFENNYANWTGAIHVTTSNGVTLESNSFKGNKCPDGGGAVEISDSSYVTIRHGLFESNSTLIAGTGGALALRNSDFITVEKVLFKSNSSNMHAGAIDSYNTTNLRIIKSEFVGNSSLSFGGAICLTMNSDSGADLIGNRFVDNSGASEKSTINIYSTAAANSMLIIEDNSFIGPGMGTNSVAISESSNEIVGHTLRNNQFYQSTFDNYYKEPEGLTKNITNLNTSSQTSHDAAVAEGNLEHP